MQGVRCLSSGCPPQAPFGFANGRKASELLSEDTSVLPVRPLRVRFYNAAVVVRSAGPCGEIGSAAKRSEEKRQNILGSFLRTGCRK